MEKIYTEHEFKNLSNLGFFHRRSNKKLSKIDSLLREYRPGMPAEKEATLLINIVIACQDFYHEKPQNGRVRAVIELHYQALTLVKKLVRQRITSHSTGYGKYGWERVKAAITPIVRSANSQSRLLFQDYWQEALIKDHFPVRDIAYSKNPFEIWKETTGNLSYAEWLDERYIPDMLETNRGKQLILRFFSNVQYLDEDQRKEKKLHIENGIFYNSLGERFHTGAMKTNVAGHGWAIYVRSTRNEIYAYSQQQHEFHHSSFLSGAPVYSAGELAVNNGKLIGITNKSGHYKPEFSHFYNMMNYLYTQKVSLRGVAACPETTGNIQEFYDAEDILQNNKNFSKRNRVKPQVL
ncbi:hypothetical protein ACGVWS_03500 [Enterobacteriaceae bacterium LUAb1]